ncbi:hypothetical protein NC653_041714 [Populus alba x Populus x berolinensis]|uniref:Cytochrome c oxidase assembly factor 3 mitochondrial coiled-coil domain-containing protein n=1 Tax=Populus alba x Populus x berolinensis TaxID=444605 RepID=A0AAD6PPI8_9ROSI|nr:hypothetical protein NC653_041714 [Populus alba x Populus x berolinensis]
MLRASDKPAPIRGGLITDSQPIAHLYLIRGPYTIIAGPTMASRLHAVLVGILVLSFTERTPRFQYNTFSAKCFGYKMAGFSSLAPKTKNLVVAGGLSAFVFGVYFYTMRAVGGTDELQTAIDKFEQQKSKEESEATIPSKA